MDDEEACNKETKVSGICLTGLSHNIAAGRKLQLKAAIIPDNAKNKKLKWTSSNTKWATVNGSGKVKALKAGKGKKVKITVQATDGSGKKKTVTIKITK